jgi:outer membrane lipoprotein-sorting protein
MTTERWDRAALVPVRRGERRAEVVALPAGQPTVDELFTFMRDAELRFDTLRMRIEERSFTARGEQLVVIDTTLRHPDEARVTTSEPRRGIAGNYELWISDGRVVRTYSGPHKLGTERPVRRTVVGVSGRSSRDLPGTARVYASLTALPMETLPEAFIHPAGYCQNVLATGDCRVVGPEVIAGREAILLTCAHPRTIEVTADRPDFSIRMWADRADGVILRLEESMAGIVTRDAVVTEYDPNAPLSPTAFDFTFPTGTTMLY